MTPWNSLSENDRNSISVNAFMNGYDEWVKGRGQKMI